MKVGLKGQWEIGAKIRLNQGSHEGPKCRVESGKVGDQDGSDRMQGFSVSLLPQPHALYNI